ncbi:atherin-like isoform X1 [Parus major]|uniref:atherin-like isoform X1 n=1 Tax=Parus major TaxID=9157 RepID=UPI00144413F8|nr:atherin-like isoform X1 [Parus major]
MRNVRAQGMVFAAGAAITPGSEALSLPTRCPAAHVPPRLQARGDVICPSPASPGPASQKSRPKLGAVRRAGRAGHAPAAARQNPRAGPVYQHRQPARDSASSAPLPLPPGTRESPPARSEDAPAKCGGKRGAHANGSSARGAGSTKQCQGSAGSQRLNPATRSRRMSVQSQLALPRRSCRIQLATFPPRNSYPGAVATREGHPAPQMQPRGEV